MPRRPVARSGEHGRRIVRGQGVVAQRSGPTGSGPSVDRHRQVAAQRRLVWAVGAKSRFRCSPCECVTLHCMSLYWRASFEAVGRGAGTCVSRQSYVSRRRGMLGKRLLLLMFRIRWEAYRFQTPGARGPCAPLRIMCEADNLCLCRTPPRICSTREPPTLVVIFGGRAAL